MAILDVIGENIESAAKGALSVLTAVFMYYVLFGTSGNIEEIRTKAPAAIEQRGWEIMREEGYKHGRFDVHGGKVYYHVRNVDNHNIQYRVHISLWDGELQYYYGSPEKLNRFDVNIDQ